MTFSRRQLEYAGRHLHAAAQLVLDAISEPPISGLARELRSSLVLGEFEKAARALGYRLEKNGGHHDDEGSD